MKVAIKVGYWIVASVLMLAILRSLDYSGSVCGILSASFLPGALALCIFLPAAAKSKYPMVGYACVILGTLLLQLLLVIWIHYVLSSNPGFFSVPVAPMMVNPIFLTLITGSFAGGYYAFSRFMDKRFSSPDEPVSFISDRKTVSLPIGSISHVESHDTEVWIYTRSGEHYRNKSPISQWERVLGERFIRVHRSYLVAIDTISEISPTEIRLGEVMIPVSRKYRDTLGTLKKEV